MRVQVSPLVFCGCSSIGRASPFQGECCGFDSRRPLCSCRIPQLNKSVHTSLLTHIMLRLNRQGKDENTRGTDAPTLRHETKVNLVFESGRFHYLNLAFLVKLPMLSRTPRLGLYLKQVIVKQSPLHSRGEN